eukprot:Gb_22129 [translate_table: standard]
MLGFIFLHMLMYAADIYLWQRYRINYPFIFGFKSGTELGYREVLLITTGISLFSLAGIISNLQMKTEKLSTIAESIPLLLVSVLLPDFFLADQLTSQFSVIFSNCRSPVQFIWSCIISTPRTIYRAHGTKASII